MLTLLWSFIQTREALIFVIKFGIINQQFAYIFAHFLYYRSPSQKTLFFESEYELSSCESAPGNISNSSLLYTMAEYTTDNFQISAWQVSPPLSHVSVYFLFFFAFKQQSGRNTKIHCNLHIGHILHCNWQRFYSIKEGLLHFSVSNKQILSAINFTYMQTSYHLILDCNRASDVSIKLTCANNTLKVSWPTDVTYNGSVVDVPSVLRQPLNERIVAKGAAFYLVMLTNTPP